MRLTFDVYYDRSLEEEEPLALREKRIVGRFRRVYADESGHQSSSIYLSQVAHEALSFERSVADGEQMYQAQKY